MADLAQDCSGCAAMGEGPTRGGEVWMALVALFRTVITWWKRTGGRYKTWCCCVRVLPQEACVIGPHWSRCC
eukprot:449593-Alexandrium_andersonii.AAC.1